MKCIIMTLTAVLITVGLYGQESKSSLEFSVFNLLGDGVSGPIYGSSLGYTHELTNGLFIRPSLFMAQGGDQGNEGFLFNNNGEIDPIYLDSSSDEIQTTFSQYRSMGLGIQKAVNVAESDRLTVYLGGSYTQLRRQFLGSQTELDDGRVVALPRFSGTNAWGYSVELSYYHGINDYLDFFGRTSYVSAPSLVNFGLGLSVKL